MLKPIVLFAILTISVFAGNIAIVKKESGETFAKRGAKMILLEPGVRLFEGDILITKKDSQVGIIFDDGTLLSLGENSILNINKYIFKPATNDFDIDLDMKKGVAAFQSGKIGKLSPKSVKFRIPEGTIGIRGTKFLVQVN